jgi:4'-phosphopantetheinyl transferase EntD
MLPMPYGVRPGQEFIEARANRDVGAGPQKHDSVAVRVPENKREWMTCKNCANKTLKKFRQKYCLKCAKLFTI